ncbi:hypothetical protein Bbelb_054360 [Branchiostoma belcheri]|nr:hypothetical protein Bbelb_054360 [Branchiostoma belcheri]
MAQRPRRHYGARPPPPPPVQGQTPGMQAAQQRVGVRQGQGQANLPAPQPQAPQVAPQAVPIQVQVPQQAPPLHVQAQAAAPLAVPGQAQAAVTQAAPVQAHAQAAPQAAPDQAQAAPQAIPVQAQAAQAIPVQAQAAPQAAMLQGQAAAPQAQGNDWQQRLEALEKAHRTEGVRESLEQVLDLAKAPSHLNHALLIPALRRLEEKARAPGHPDYPTRGFLLCLEVNVIRAIHMGTRKSTAHTFRIPSWEIGVWKDDPPQPSPNLPATKWINKEGKCVSTVGPILDAEFVSSHDVAVTADNLRFRDPGTFRAGQELILITGKLREEIEEWRFLDNWEGCMQWRDERHLTLTMSSDASELKWGAVLDLPDKESITYSDYWSEQDRESVEVGCEAAPGVVESTTEDAKAKLWWAPALRCRACGEISDGDYRLAAGTVLTVVGKLKSMFRTLGQGDKWEPATGATNPAAHPTIKSYTKLIAEEQARAHVTPTQALPMFMDKFRQLIQHIEAKAGVVGISDIDIRDAGCLIGGGIFVQNDLKGGFGTTCSVILSSSRGKIEEVPEGG